MLFARIRRHKWLNTRQLAGSQGVVCKIRQPPLLVPQALLLTIPFRLPRVVLTVFLPIPWVRLAPLPRTLQADLPIHQIGSHPLPMIIGAALVLARGLVANSLLRMITISLKTLSTVAATVMLHQAAPEENGRDSFSPEAPSNAEQLLKEFSAYSAVAVFPPMWPPCLSQPAFDGGHDVRVRATGGVGKGSTIMRCNLTCKINRSSS